MNKYNDATQVVGNNLHCILTALYIVDKHDGGYHKQMMHVSMNIIIMLLFILIPLITPTYNKGNKEK